MTGKEFMDWYDGIKHIDRVEWIVQGDCLDAERIDVAVTAGGERKLFYFGSVTPLDRPDDFCKVAMAMISNRVVKQVGLVDDLGPYNIGSDPVDVVNSAIQNLKGGAHDKSGKVATDL